MRLSENAAPNGVNEPKGGTIIAGRYQIDRLIARGGMASVYLAHQVKLNRPVALKILTPPPDAEESAAFEERFRLEAETLAALDHTNIVILHDFGELDDGRFFLAMEFVDGPRMSDLLRDGPLDCERALQLVTQVASALRYAHKRGVVHRDLKPSNLLVKTDDDGTEQVKVVDFGLVKLTEVEQTITRAGLILGSPHCMSPEQVKGLDVDHRADIYAIGVLLFRVLTGQYPFHGSNSAATMIAHLNQEVPTIFSVAPDLVLPEGLEDIVRRCLAKTPSDRYQDTAELMADLATCMAHPPDQLRSGIQSSSTIQSAVVRQPLGVPQPPPARGNRLWIPATLAVVFVGFFGMSALAIVAASLFSGAGTGGGSPVLPEPSSWATEPPRIGVEEDPAPALALPPDDAIDDGILNGSEDGPDDAVGTDDPSVDGPEAVAEPVPAPAEPEPVSRPTPTPAPPRPQPVRPVPAASPVPTAPKPVVPAPAPVAPEPAPEPKNPEGYMGLPDDLQ
ncbi:MAG: serine/threonine-protein kinase [Myxococcota bacterium]